MTKGGIIRFVLFLGKVKVFMNKKYRSRKILYQKQQKMKKELINLVIKNTQYE